MLPSLACSRKKLEKTLRTPVSVLNDVTVGLRGEGRAEVSGERSHCLGAVLLVTHCTSVKTSLALPTGVRLSGWITESFSSDLNEICCCVTAQKQL